MSGSVRAELIRIAHIVKLPHSSYRARPVYLWTTTLVAPNKGLNPRLSAPRFAAVPFRP